MNQRTQMSKTTQSAIKRPLVVIGTYGQMGGAERQAIHLIQYFRETHQLPVAVLSWYGEGPLSDLLKQMGCEVFNFPYNIKASGVAKLRMLHKLAQFIKRKIQPDVILPFVSIHSKPLCLIWKWTGAQYCWWNQQDEGRGLYGSKMERRALLNAVHITSNSHAGAEFLHKTYNIPLEKIIVYNNGTPMPENRLSKPIWREQLQIADGQQMVSMLANITQFKDHETLLKAWGLLKANWKSQRPLPILALAGGLQDKALVTSLKALAFDLRLSDCVNFLGSIRSTNELIQESDLVVHSSIKEGCPNAVCEAMALGKPVIGTDISGMRQALGDKAAELVYARPKDPEDLSAKIHALLNDSQKCAELGAANRERIRSEFSIQGMNQFFCDLIASRLVPSVEKSRHA